MHLKTDSIEIKINDEADAKHFDSLKNRYQRNLEPIKCSEFVFDYLQLLSYIKRATINPIYEKDKKNVFSML